MVQFHKPKKTTIERERFSKEYDRKVDPTTGRPFDYDRNAVKGQAPPSKDSYRRNHNAPKSMGSSQYAYYSQAFGTQQIPTQSSLLSFTQTQSQSQSQSQTDRSINTDFSQESFIDGETQY